MYFKQLFQRFVIPPGSTRQTCRDDILALHAWEVKRYTAQPAAGQTFLCLLRNLKRLILVGLYLEACGWIMKNKKTKKCRKIRHLRESKEQSIGPISQRNFIKTKK